MASNRLDTLSIDGSDARKEYEKIGRTAEYYSKLINLLNTRKKIDLEEEAKSNDPLKRIMVALNPNTPHDTRYYLLKDGPDSRVRIAAMKTVGLLREKKLSQLLKDS